MLGPNRPGSGVAGKRAAVCFSDASDGVLDAPGGSFG